MKKKEFHTFYNYQFKHTAVTVTNHPNIQAIDVAEVLKIHPIMLYRWRGESTNVYLALSVKANPARKDPEIN